MGERLPSPWFMRRAALAALVVVSRLTTANSAMAQTAGPSGLSQGVEMRPTDALRQLGAPPIIANDTAPGAAPAGQLRSGFQQSEPLSSGAANYARPRPRLRLPRPYPPPFHAVPAPFSPQHPLPPLEPYRTSAQGRRALRLHSQTALPEAALPAPPPTVAAKPTIKAKPKPKVEERPYDPVGVEVGSLRLKPFVEASFGYDSNPNRLSTNSTGSKYLRSDAGFDLKSDWSRHDLQGSLRLGYSDYFDLQAASRPDGAGDFKGRYDVTRDTAINLEGRFNLDTQRPGAPALASGLSNVVVTNRPLIVSGGLSPGVTQKFNRLELSLRGSFDRTVYQNAHYSDGSTLNLASTDYNAYGGTARVAYEVNPDVKPFVEATLDKRVHDSAVDVSGYLRDNHGLAARGGASVRISDLLKGEASGGYAERQYADLRLAKLRGPTIDAALIYTPSALTTVKLRGATVLSETTVSGAAGVLTRTFSAQLSHEFLRNLTATLTGSHFTNDYQGAAIYERGYTAGVKLEYKITRSIVIRGSYSHERLNSTSSGSDYTANVFLIGLRLQP
jgi:hypothetical protein